jgi:tetratricopeptide (TPR) repeat protein
MIIARCYYKMGNIKEAMAIYDIIFKLDRHNQEAKDFLMSYDKATLIKYQNSWYKETM